MKSNGNIVKLDIGGTLFKTSISTLTKFDGFFKTMLETDVPITKDESGAIFIDRDPKYFLLILNFMRDGHVELPETIREVRELCVEAEYYLLTGLVQLCSPNITTDIVKLNVGGTVFQTTKTTLTRKDSLLKQLISKEDQIVRDVTGCIFIDRDPKHFRLILNFMRDGVVEFPEMISEVRELWEDALCYQLTGLGNLCSLEMEKKRAEEYSKIPKSLSSGEIVELNVGGTKFQTTRDTLTRYGGYFRTLMSDESKAIRDEHGCIFIDRPPKHFHFILGSMMTNYYTLPHCTKDVGEIETEAKFYDLEVLTAACVEYSKKNRDKCCGYNKGK